MTDQTRRPRIAVDAMGGDIGPEATVSGALQALRDGVACELLLYGDQSRIEVQLAAARQQGDVVPDLAIEIVPCTEDIPMDAAPATAVRGKPDSPIVKAMRHQREGRVDAVVSAGSTGAMVAASLLILGRLRSVERPAIGTFIPTVRGETLLVDAGANTAATPELLLCFARMGAAYCRAMQGLPCPAVGLLNIGSEPSKGSDLMIATHALLQEAELDFTGNVEGNEVMLGRNDVLVADGFTGNIALKLIEGFAQFLKALGGSGMLTEAELAGLAAFSVAIKRRFTYEVYGGAPLLGVDGVSIICHGRSTPVAFTHAVRVAAQQAQCRLPVLIDQALQSAQPEG